MEKSQTGFKLDEHHKANRYATTLMFSAYTVCTATSVVIELFFKLTEIDIIRRAI